MKETIRLTAALTIICMIATVLLTYVNDLTKEPIAKAQALQKAKALKQILPPFDNNPFDDAITLKTSDGEFKILPGKQNNKIISVVISGYTMQGFSGKIEAMVGFDKNQNITNIIITKHAETPGLGTKVCNRKEQKTLNSLFSNKKITGIVPNKFLDQFNGRNLVTLTNKDKIKFDAISGATVSSKAVVDAVSRIATEYLKYINKIGDVK